MVVTLKARDVMEEDVITVGPSLGLDKVWNIFRRNHISGVPVVDSQEGLVGVISQTDIIREAFLGGGPAERSTSFYVGYSLWDLEEADESLSKLGQATVRELMSTHVVTVSPEDAVSSCAVLMRKHHIHRLIVTEDSNVVGIVSALGLLQVLERH